MIKNHRRQKNKKLIGRFSATFLIVVVCSILSFSAVSTSAWNSDLSTDILSFWRMNETSGDIIDALGNYNGTNHGADYGAAGLINASLDFENSSSDYVYIPQVDFTGSPMTFSTWVEIESHTSSAVVMGHRKDTTPYNWRMITVENDGSVTFSIRGADDLLTADSVSAVVTDSGWYHLAGTYNGSTAVLYINGLSNATDTGDIGTIQDTALSIGRLEGNNDSYYDGRVDEVGIWDRALSASEILQLYNDGNGLTYNNYYCTYNYNGTNVSVSCGSTAPTITSPGGTYDFAEAGDTFYLNYTIGSTDYSEAITLEETTDLTFWYENETGVYEEDVDWDYSIFSNTQTYPTTAVESSVETYTSNITYNSDMFPLISGILTLNNTNYTGSRTGSGNSSVFSASATMPSVDSATNFSTYWTILLTNATGTYAYDLTSHNVTVSPINFSLCDAGNPVPFWNFTILNESNGAEVQASFTGTFIISPVGATYENTFSFSDTTDTNSHFDFCIYPATSNYTISTNIQLSKSGYVTKTYDYQDVVVSSATREDNLYMLADADSTSFIVHVINSNGEDVEEAEVQVQRYYPGTGSWVTTEILTTNYEGESVGHLLSEDADYRFQVFESGINTYNSSSTKITCATAPCTVTLTIPVSGISWIPELNDLTSSLTWNTATNTFTYTYTDSSSDFENARLYVYKLAPSNATLYIPCNETKTTSSGVITCDITGSINGTYRADAYITRAETETLVERETASIGTELYHSFGDDGVLWGIFVLIGVAMLGAYRPSLGIIFGVVGLFIVGLIGLINIGVISLFGIVAVGIILLVRIKKE